MEPDQLSTIGYPKYDLIPARAAKLPFQSNGRPTVFYNPHVSPHLSSWFKHGLAVLEWFAAHPEYNLIFAPHVMLFHRPVVLTIDKLRIDRVGRIPAHIWNAPNIHIDLGSSASTDMTYTSAADIYLGDVSSQVYEFLHSPRPCIFLDSHGVDHHGDANYKHWRAGEVITCPSQLGEVLDRAAAEHVYYGRIQRQLFDESFALTAEPSSIRAARAIMGVLSPVAPVELFPKAQVPARKGKLAVA